MDGGRRSPAPEVVRAQRFELVDSAGRVCAQLGATADNGGGSSELVLFDRKGEDRAGHAGAGC
jgi:hypothetical protein